MKLKENNIEFVKVTFNFITNRNTVIIMLKDREISNMRIYSFKYGETIVLPKSVQDFITGKEHVLFDKKDNEFVSYIYK